MLRLVGPFPEVRAGQFCMLRSVADWPVLLPRPFSYFDVLPAGDEGLGLPSCVDEAEGVATFLGKAVGPGTKRLQALRPGDEVVLTGPLGRAWPAVASSAELAEDAVLDSGANSGVSSALGSGGEPVCIAGGVGLAPFLLWTKERRQRNPDAVLPILYGGANEAAIVAREDFAAVGPSFHVATDDGSLGFHGNVLQLYQDLVAKGEIDAGAPVYCCGPDPMMKALAAYCCQRGLRCVLSLESYMACGYGVCNGCAVEVVEGGRFAGRRYAKCCTDGPVFEADELLWQEAAAQ